MSARKADRWRRARRIAYHDLWPVVQATTAGMVAWIVAKYLIKHHEPFFAPIAAVVAINATTGERGTNAVRLLLGVFVGIISGDVVLALLGPGYGRMALAIFVAMSVARAFGGTRIVLNQAAASAILTVALTTEQGGLHRLEDALIGAGVALVFTQFFFSPEPVRLVRRAETAVIESMAQSLMTTAAALEANGTDLTAQAMTSLEKLRDHLAELGRVRRVSTQVARHSAIWRSHIADVVRENENAGHLDLLGSSCALLVRVALETEPSERRAVTPSVREMADALADLALDPGDHQTRQRLVERAVDVTKRLMSIDAPTSSTLINAIVVMRMLTSEVMLFAGVDPKHVLALSREAMRQLVPLPARTFKLRLGHDRWRALRDRRGRLSREPPSPSSGELSDRPPADPDARPEQ